MTTATVSSPPIATSDQAVRLSHVSWEAYERLLADDEARRSPRLTYDRGELVIGSPSLPHELDAHALAKVVEIVADELDIDDLPTGSTTFRSRSAERGFEADASFYLRRSSEILGRRGIDLDTNPPRTWRSRSTSLTRRSPSSASTPVWAFPKSGAASATRSRSTSSTTGSTSRPHPVECCRP